MKTRQSDDLISPVLIYLREKIEKGRNAFKILTNKPRGNSPTGRSRRRWEDNIRMDLKKIGINSSNWVDSAQNRSYWGALVNAALNLRIP